MKQRLQLTVNGSPVAIDAHPMARLLDVLRQDLRLTGTKEGCGEGECGACSVLIDGALANSCLVPALHAAGRSVTTIEGIAGDPRFEALRHAFVRCGAAQCGICTPGMFLAAADLLARNTTPTETDVRGALSGNLCRCTGYMRIFEAVLEASRGIPDSR